MEAEVFKGTFVSGTIVIALTDPPKLARREGDPPVTVDEPRPESVTYGLMIGAQWEAGAGVLTTKHGLKRTDGTRLVKESMSRGSVLRSSNDGKRLTIDEGGEVDLMIVRGGESLNHRLQVIEGHVQLALRGLELSANSTPSDDLPTADPEQPAVTSDVDARLAAIHRDPNAPSAE